MRNNIMGRSIAALAAVVTVAGSGFLMAAPDPTYVPQSSVILGPATLAPGASANYTFRVTFSQGQISNFPPETGATFTTIGGTYNSTTGVFTAGNGPKAKLSASFTQNGRTVTSSVIIAVRASS